MEFDDKEKQHLVIRRIYKPNVDEHGGAWKIALADYMTIMFAMFFVLWIIGLDQDIRDAIEGYWADPMGWEGQVLARGGQVSPMDGGDAVIPMSQGRNAQQMEFEDVRDRVQAILEEDDEFSHLSEYIEIRITEEGLVIDFLDAEESFFFETASAQVRPQARRLFLLIGSELARLPNPLVFEGHTDARPFIDDSQYGNWELSADRANAVRRVMMTGDIPADQVEEIRGHADQVLRRPDEPDHFSNRRVSIVARFMTSESVWFEDEVEPETP